MGGDPTMPQTHARYMPMIYGGEVTPEHGQLSMSSPLKLFRPLSPWRRPGAEHNARPTHRNGLEDLPGIGFRLTSDL
jgi:hypothetical protein